MDQVRVVGRAGTRWGPCGIRWGTLEGMDELGLWACLKLHDSKIQAE